MRRAARSVLRAATTFGTGVAAGGWADWRVGAAVAVVSAVRGGVVGEAGAEEADVPVEFAPQAARRSEASRRMANHRVFICLSGYRA